MRMLNKFKFKAALVLVFTIGFLVIQTAEGATVANKPYHEMNIEQTAEPMQTQETLSTEEPAQSPEVSEVPEQTFLPTEEPAPTPHVQALKKVTGVQLIRYATDKVKVTWKQNKKAKYYRVYYSKKRVGGYRCAGVTKGTRYLVKRLKNNTKYYFYVQACKAKKKTGADSAPSEKKYLKTKTYQRKTVFAGDSICEGIGYPGWAYPYMDIGGKRQVIAYRGLNTVTFHTKRVFEGKTGMQKLISENPYRAYMMLGINEIHYRSADEMIAEYQSMLQAIRQACPDTDIVLCALSPVTSAEKARRSGYGQIPSFNKKLKKLAKKLNMRYFDYTGFLQDSSGCLKAEYAERDGYHWKMQVYSKFAKVVAKYDKSLDR